MSGLDLGLDLGPYLRLLQTDWWVWASLVAVVVILGLMTWASLGRRRVLRKCLVVSILIHGGLIAWGGQASWGLRAFGPAGLESLSQRERIQQIEVLPESTDGAIDGAGGPGSEGGDGTGKRPLAAWELPSGASLVKELKTAPVHPELEATAPARPEEVALAPVALDAPSPDVPPPTAEAPEARPAKTEVATETKAEPIAPTAADLAELPEVAMAPRGETLPDPVAPARPTVSAARSNATSPRPTAMPREVTRTTDVVPLVSPNSAPPATRDIPPLEGPSAPALAEGSSAPAVELGAGEGPGVSSDRPIPESPALALPTIDERSRPASSRPLPAPIRPNSMTEPLAFARATPAGAFGLSAGPRPSLAARPLPDVPPVYRPRLDPDRSRRAKAAGASGASEEAVERALMWLALHQDADGRWNAATTRDTSGNVIGDDHDFTIHCPPGEVCAGECYYWEADSAVTGLALLAYLGAGYTHRDGKQHAGTVEKGLHYLLSIQKANGDLRGPSVAIGMYCHAMATMALGEAYALTGDEELKAPFERAIRFLVRSRASDGMSWRYQPGEPIGDTSILGWVILALKSARENGVPVSDSTRTGALEWLETVARGPKHGLACYQPGKGADATMTAEAWVCREFLGVGGAGPASDEAAAYMLARGPAKGPLNLYYWYYGTLAFYQRGGSDWEDWNSQVRDELVKRQKVKGHAAGSWDPRECTDRYDSLGGRIYCTTIATLTLEVYYRYQRMEEILKPQPLAPANDSGVRRSRQ